MCFIWHNFLISWIQINVLLAGYVHQPMWWKTDFVFQFHRVFALPLSHTRDSIDCTRGANILFHSTLSWYLAIITYLGSETKCFFVLHLLFAYQFCRSSEPSRSDYSLFIDCHAFAIRLRKSFFNILLPCTYPQDALAVIFTSNKIKKSAEREWNVQAKGKPIESKCTTYLQRERKRKRETNRKCYYQCITLDMVDEWCGGGGEVAMVGSINGYRFIDQTKLRQYHFPADKLHYMQFVW